MTHRTTLTVPAIFLLTMAAFFALPSTLFAATDIVATPMVIDGKGKVREIFHHNLTLTNTTKRLVSVYPWVTDVSTMVGSEGQSDLDGSREKLPAESLARWIEITRGSIDLLPGETRSIPLTIQINVNAKHGLYHAAVHLSVGNDRAAAEANTAQTVDIAVNMDVLEDINERLQLNTFIPAKNFFTSDTASFQYSIENIGNRGEIPRGKVRIYDRRGAEVATIDANQDAKRIEPNAKEMLSSVWSAGNNFGRYKAMLDVDYGARGTLQDTVFFWLIPWTKLLGMFFTIALLCVLGAIGLHSYGLARRVPAISSEYGGRLRGLREVNDEDALDVEEEYVEQKAHGYGRQKMVNEMRQMEIPVTARAPRSLGRHIGEAWENYFPFRTEKEEEIPEEEEVPHRERHAKTGAVHRPKVATTHAHQVHLPKREKPAPPPHHIVHLRKRS